jgi:DNA-binding NarL/FixJ family response regulator
MMAPAIHFGGPMPSRWLSHNPTGRLELQRTRIVLAGMPQLLQDVVRDVVLDQPDMEVVGEVGSLDEMLVLATRMPTDVVLMGPTENELPGPVFQLLQEEPHLKVLGLIDGGRRAYLYELRPHREVLEDVSIEELLKAIRSLLHTHAM